MVTSSPTCKNCLDSIYLQVNLLQWRYCHVCKYEYSDIKQAKVSSLVLVRVFLVFAVVASLRPLQVVARNKQQDFGKYSTYITYPLCNVQATTSFPSALITQQLLLNGFRFEPVGFALLFCWVQQTDHDRENERCAPQLRHATKMQLF